MTTIQDTLRALAARTSARKGRTLARTEARNARMLDILSKAVADLRSDADKAELSPSLRALALRGLTKAENALARFQEAAEAKEAALAEDIEALDRASKDL